MRLNVQYGCGLVAPKQWINFDASPTLRLQKIPLLGRFVKKVNFPQSVKYGDIIKGLPGVHPQSCEAIYCSHILEHLSLNDFRLALVNTFDMLKLGGSFRCVLPDLEASILTYLDQRIINPSLASIEFMKTTMLGVENRPLSFKSRIMDSLGNSNHLWMWDQYSLSNELYQAGFRKVRKASLFDSEYTDFNLVEKEGRFWNAICFEAIK